MLLKCCLLYWDIVLPRHTIVSIFVYILGYVCFIYVIYFGINIFIFIIINHIIPLKQTNLFLGHVCQKLGLRVLVNFCLFFCQFQPGVSYVLLIKKVYNVWFQLCKVSKSVIVSRGVKKNPFIDQPTIIGYPPIFRILLTPLTSQYLSLSLMVYRYITSIFIKPCYELLWRPLRSDGFKYKARLRQEVLNEISF